LRLCEQHIALGPLSTPPSQYTGKMAIGSTVARQAQRGDVSAVHRWASLPPPFQHFEVVFDILDHSERMIRALWKFQAGATAARLVVLPGWRSAPDQGSPAQRTLVRWGANRWASWSQPSPAGCHDALLAASVEVPRAPSAPPRTLASPRTEVRRRSVKRVGRTPCQTPRGYSLQDTGAARPA